jgi:hypothetical protein
MDDRIFVRLKILSEQLTPDQLDSMIGIKCDEGWLRGGFKPRTKMIARKHGWLLESGLPTSAPIEDHISSLLARLSPFAGKIKLISDEADVSFSCVIYTNTRQGLCFNSSTVNAIYELGASLEIDLYISHKTSKQ